MITIDPSKIEAKDMHQFVLGSVAPRPIAFASTIDENGRPNLAPYSFFNAFSSNPPILVFSSNRRLSDNTTKDTLYNVRKTGEVVINVVNYNIVRQMAVASIEFPSGVSEFEQAGLTPIPSDLVAPPRVKESPVHMECKVQEIIPLGEEGGAGHLIICRILRMHISKDVVDDGRINPHKIDLMGRMGRAYYVRASGEAIHTIVQPVTPPGIGFGQLPQSAKASHVLTANDLGRFAGMAAGPSVEIIEKLKMEAEIALILTKKHFSEELHRLAHNELAQENLSRAAALVWLAEEHLK
ncbi:MAG: flavin reductase family protein [Saprospiraceae bacterium]|nr:flavin reductase family protein [Saprospiraceae bacterium]MCB9326492.1 flavin reductase family protein [Lewinellaceae bacterium]